VRSLQIQMLTNGFVENAHGLRPLAA